MAVLVLTTTDIIQTR